MIFIKEKKYYTFQYIIDKYGKDPRIKISDCSVRFRAFPYLDKKDDNYEQNKGYKYSNNHR